MPILLLLDMTTFTAFRADTFIQKTKKLYMDTRANRNHLKMMSEDLRDIQGIMTKNIQEVLGRGELLESNVQKLRIICLNFFDAVYHSFVFSNSKSFIGAD